MDTAEFPKAMRAIGCLVTLPELESMLRRYDPKKLGYISFHDFQNCVAEVFKKPDGT